MTISTLNDLMRRQDFAAAEQVSLAQIAQGECSSEVWFYLSVACHSQGKYARALDALQNILGSIRDNPNLHSLHAAILSSLHRNDEALGAAMLALELVPDSPQYLANVGAIYQQSADFQQAISFYKQALELNSSELSANINLGTSLLLAGQPIEAKEHCLAAIQRIPNSVELYNTLAEAYIQTVEWDKALDACRSGLKINDRFAVLCFKMGLVLSYLQQFDEAQVALDKAQSLDADIAVSYFSNQRLVKTTLKEVRKKKVNARAIFLEMAYIRQTKCDWHVWNEFPKVFAEFVSSASLNEISTSLAFQVFDYPIGSQARLGLMRRIALSIENEVSDWGVQPFEYTKKVSPQLNIGYISADFRIHPTSILTRQIYRMHDRMRYKIYAYSLYNDAIKDSYRRDVEENCDVFVDAVGLSDIELAHKINHDQIDILVDLAGYGVYSRPEVLALRPAPIQIGYLGFLSTLGADFMDYALVDKIVCSDEHMADWSEKLIRLPNSLFVYDNELDNAATSLTRKDYGLPDEAIVFCCFNNDHKVEPVIFGRWMNILREVPNAVLWVLGADAETCLNLKAEALRHEIDESRIVFAGRVPLPVHLKRYQLADIFLDTYWYNAHTTAIEALWQGLPVLTCMGEVTSSRVAGSFLKILDFPELIASDFDEYHKLAIYYATDSNARLALKSKLKIAVGNSPLFDTPYALKHIELAYEMVWNRYASGLQPEHIDVPAIPVLNW
ncbi:MAG: hypothetical protein ACAH12_10085 [Methylophilaceae bacterium]